MTTDDPKRLARLKKLFESITCGKVTLSPGNAKTYLEAIYKHESPVDCITTVMTNSPGREALLDAISSDTSIGFFNKEVAFFIRYLRDEKLVVINNGQLLDDVVTGLAGRKIFWMTFGKAFLEGTLDENGTLAFGWLYWKLCRLPTGSQTDTPAYRNDSDMQTIFQRLKTSTNSDIHHVGTKIEEVYLASQSIGTAVQTSVDEGPGGRHDNDHADFRQISILPTQEEITCKATPFLRPSSFLEDPSTATNRVALHLDNQFRLLREDMVSELKEEFQIAKGEKKGFHRGVMVKGLSLLEITSGPPNKRDKDKLGLICVCKADLPQLEKFSEPEERNAFLKDKPNFFKHQSLTCLIVDKELIAFANIHRDEQRLIKKPPEIVLQFEDEKSMQKALYNFKMKKEITLIQINTAVFAYEPILTGLQQAKSLALSTELVLWEDGDHLEDVEVQPELVLQAMRANPKVNLKPILSTPKDIILDSSQARSLISGLTQKVSLIQGPPGTGKSFIGALVAKSIHDLTDRTILVVCYTNHALDDILEGLLDIGIPESSMVRLGGKCTPRTEPLQLQKQPRGSRLPCEWDYIDELRTQLETLYLSLERFFMQYNSSAIHLEDILDFLEFADEDLDFFGAFQVPASEDGFQVAGSDNKAAGPDYLLDRWANGHDPGRAFADHISQSEDHKTVWNLSLDARKKCMARWKDELLRESIGEICITAMEYNRCHRRLIQALRSDTAGVLRSKRIVGCTTTAAAKYREEIQTFNPDILLVEEAGEILESHVLTSLGPETSQVILIGDHKQLRPKVNNYMLTVEKGEGYDLNRSLFERLILKRYPHESLSQQHRMRPEISALIRELTYPELIDAPKTQNRPDIRGLQDNIIFINHDQPEDDFKQLADRKDMASNTSKQNTYEINMILKIVRYLGQQGYGTKDLVVLTPYLGQLHKLRELLKKDNDPILNDLDSYELVQAGLLNPGAARMKKKPIRLATIDNYQGEESDIVVISLTRSNKGHDIGFMSSPERLNVLLSRARNGMIMLGNAHTFKNARKGKENWQILFNMLEANQHVYEGLPVRCERHRGTTATLSQPAQFDAHCPEGGCIVPCGAILPCQHPCPRRCHQQDDHSKVECVEMMPHRCPAGHSQVYKCSKGPPKICHACERAQRLAKEKQKRDLEEQQKRDEEQRAHLQAMDDLNAKLDEAQRDQQQEQLRQQRKLALAQKRQDLENLKSSPIPVTIPDSVSNTGPPTPPKPVSNPQQPPDLVGTANASSVPVGSPPTSPSTKSPVQQNGKSSLLSKMWEAVTNFSSSPAAAQDGRDPQPASSTGKPFKKLAPSQSQQRWEHEKKINGAKNDAIDAIMQMTGLEDVKKQVLNVLAKIDTSNRQKASLQRERFNVTFLGNPGTGKTTIARHYAKFLASVKVIPGDTFEERTGARLAQEGVDATKQLLDDVTKKGGGVIFIDEAYQLTSGNSHGGPAVLDYLLAEMENRVGTLVFILAGYNKEMEKFFEHNPGLKSRVPYQFHFADYQDEELMSMFVNMINKTYLGCMKVEDGVEGLYGRIVIRRLGRRRGHPGFGNARDLENILSRIKERQASRLTQERAQGGLPDDFLFTYQDLIGPDPSVAILQSNAWERLQSLIGLKAVKDTVSSLVSITGENYKRELQEKEPLEISLNRVFLGSPGTGKTTVAKLYGQILADIGLLSNGEVVLKNPADFMGAVLGASEANTKAILANSVGKVLIIDEAYMLYGGGGNDSNHGSQSNQFKTSVIDTIVAEVQSTPGEDRCVLLLGYRDQMVEMFQNVNPGLSRRFKIEDAFNFDDFTDDELGRILDLKLKDQDLGATDSAKKAVIDILARMRNRPNFGNAGEVENLITQAKTRALARRKEMSASERPIDIVFIPEDFDPDYNRDAKAAANLAKLFEDIIGHESIKQRLANYQQMAAVCKARDLDPRDQIPMNFIFTGPPGTGKTTIARKVGHVFYDMGLLSSAEVFECSASDLVGQYVGHTGPKTRKLFEKALGKVLFVDEAYRLSEGHFAQEAIDELVGLLTHPSFKGKLVVVLAGYEQDMNRLMSVNTGLASRFPHQVVFPNMTAEECMKVIEKEVKKKCVELEGWHDESSDSMLAIKESLRDLAELPDWGNARDMVTLAKEMIGKALLQDHSTQDTLKISSNEALEVVKKMVEDRHRRSKIPKKHRQVNNLPVQTQDREPSPPPSTSVGTSTSQANPRANTAMNRGRGNPPRGANRGRGRGRGRNVEPQQANNTRPQNNGSDGRDPGVSDAIWNELNTRKRAAEAEERRIRKEIDDVKAKAAAQRRKEEEEKEKARELERRAAQEKEAARKAELDRQKQAAWLKAEAARQAKMRAEAELRAKEEAERRRREQEEKAQRKLRQMGVCPAGFHWINMGSYYLCAGGTHSVPTSSLEL